MTTQEINKLRRMKVNELQAMFAEVVGETTRSPNRTYLIRRITEAAARPAIARPAGKAEAAEMRAAKPAEAADLGVAPHDAGTNQHERSVGPGASNLLQLDIPGLQACYLEVVGRPTGSTNRQYLVWKIREARKGHVSVGPRQSPRKAEGGIQVLPLRMETAVVAQIDEIWRRLGLRSRAELFRRALRALLLQEGNVELANLLGADA